MLCSELNSSTSLKFTYTPMHGVGYPFFAEAMKVFGFAPCITVAEQVHFVLIAVMVMCEIHCCRCHLNKLMIRRSVLTLYRAEMLTGYSWPSRVPKCQKLKCKFDLDGTEHFEM